MIAALVLYTTSALADWKPGTVPAACNNTTDAFFYFKDEGLTPWVLSEITTDAGVVLIMMIWRDKQNNIITTTNKKGSNVTCIVAMGDTGTVILDR